MLLDGDGSTTKMRACVGFADASYLSGASGMFAGDPCDTDKSGADPPLFSATDTAPSSWLRSYNNNIRGYVLLYSAACYMLHVQYFQWPLGEQRPLVVRTTFNCRNGVSASSTGTTIDFAS